MTVDGGYLSLLPEISDFQLRVACTTPRDPFGSVTYNCQREAERVRLIPQLSGGEGEREMARQIASQWSGGKRRYCFTLDLDDLCQMAEEKKADIDFSGLSYAAQSKPRVSKARLSTVGLSHCLVGGHVTADDTAESMRDLLGGYGVSKSGNKRVLVEKLAALAARVYATHESELDDYFAANRFIRAGGCNGPLPGPFPVLGACRLGEMVWY